MRYVILFMLLCGPVMAAGFPPNCPDTAGNHLNYTSSTNAYLCGTSGGSGGSITLGTSASANNPQRTGDATTGLFSAATSTVSVSISGVDQADFTSSGLTLANNLSANNFSSYVMSRTVPATVNDYVNIGTFVTTDGPMNLFVSLTYDNGSGIDSIAKTYILSGFYSESGGIGWSVVSPISKADQYGTNNFNLEALESNATLTLRIHKTAGVSALTGRVQIVDYGATVFTASTTTGTDTQPTTIWYGAVAPLGQNISNKGSYNLLNWNGSGGQIFDYFTANQNNGGSTIAASQPALVLAREGIGAQSYANFAEFKLSRFENVSTNARTQLDFALTYGNGDATGTDIMSLRSNGNVGIGSTAPRSVFDLSQNTGAEILPIGTTGQRPTAVEGMLRKNSTLNLIEGYVNALWAQILSGSAGTPTCGAGCSSITATSTDARGSATSGTLATSVVVSFSGTLSTAPFCTATGSNTAAVLGCSSSTTALTCGLSTALTGDVISWHCVQ